MPKKDYVLGVLKSAGMLSTDKGDVLLTTIKQQAAEDPQEAVLEWSDNDAGKMALASGQLSADVLYSSTLVEVISPVTASLIKSLIKKNIINTDNLSEQLGELQKEVTPLIKKKLCALVIGHNKQKPGAANEAQDITEYEFNDNLAQRIEKKVKLLEVQRVYRRTYKGLPGDINELGPDLVISLHCNAFNREATGTEVLYYHNSAKSKEIAQVMQTHLVDYLGLSDRGIKGKATEDRGGYLLRYTNAPCVIVEPFFIDNNKDLAKAQEDLNGLAKTYAKAIDEIAVLVA